jgi:hypothetical protein
MRQSIPLAARERPPSSQVRLRASRTTGGENVTYVRFAPTAIAAKNTGRGMLQSQPLEELITGYFLAAAKVLVQFQKK